MTEGELLKKIATTAIKARKLKERYEYEMREYVRKHPNVDRRYSKAATEARKSITDPIYNELKEARRQLDGYLFMYECKEWVKP